MPSESNKVDIAYKKFLKRRYTSTNKKWHEEKPAKALNIKLRDIWFEEIPDTPPVSDTSVVQVISNLELTHDVTVDNHKSWLACQTIGDESTLLGDWIQPDQDIKQGYYVKLFDSNGNRIYTGDDIEWSFDYSSGILTLENPPVNYVPPFYISGYRYIGRRGFDRNDFTTPLDQAYDGPEGGGSGRIIHADFGPVNIKASNGSAALQLDPVEYTPTTGLSDGQIINRRGILYIYDSSRNKWLAMQRQQVSFGIKRADGCYLNIADFSSSNSGWPAVRSGTILSMTATASSGYPGKKFQILLNNNQVPIHQFALSNHYYSTDSLNIDFQTNDIIKILATSQFATTYNVVVNLEIAWRI